MAARKKLNLAYVLAAFVIGIACGLFFILDQPGGPVTDMTGTILNIGSLPSAGAPTRMATVQFADGDTVQATVLENVQIAQGQAVRLRRYQRILSGRRTYEVTEPLRH